MDGATTCIHLAAGGIYSICMERKDSNDSDVPQEIDARFQQTFLEMLESFDLVK
jgi:hypothetical protein